MTTPKRTKPLKVERCAIQPGDVPDLCGATVAPEVPVG